MPRILSRNGCQQHKVSIFPGSNSDVMTLFQPFLSLVLFFAGAASLLAMVNPALQPEHLAERHNSVVVLEVTGLEGDMYQFDVKEVLIGEFAPAQATIKLPAGQADAESDLMGMTEAAPLVLNDGDVITAFVSRVGRRGTDELIFYAGNRVWHEARIPDMEQMGTWQWTAQSPEAMSGTWNGASLRLVEIIKDIKAGSIYFPAQAHTRFGDDLIIEDFEEPVRGVGIHDFDGDGRADVIAATPDGVRIYLQKEGNSFEDATVDFGLDGIKATHLSLADVDADGRPDLLLDAVVFFARDGKFEKSNVLPESAGKNLHASTFADVNGNGYPDVVISTKGGGLTVFHNPGEAGGSFVDAGEASGLREEKANPEGTGYFAVGDWTGNGRADIYYGAGRALILEQGEDGKFSPAAGRLNIDLRDNVDFADGLTGAGSFAPLWTEDRFDIAIPTDSRLALLTRLEKEPRDVTGQGNEVGVAPTSLWATIAEDLSANGHVDLFSLTRLESGSSNVFHLNRGYGSYMFPERYETVFSGGSYTTGAGGGAAGDVTGDGANDLVLGGLDGRLVLSVNNSLALRTPVDHPTTEHSRLMSIRLLTVIPEGKLGVLGAVVTLVDSSGSTIARRQIGTGMPVGNFGPHIVNIGVREHGEYQLNVRFSDGMEKSQVVNIGKLGRQVVKVSR
jgi:hypothetical protein